MEGFVSWEWFDGLLAMLVGATVLVVVGTCVLWTIPMPQPFWIRVEGECGECGGSGSLAVENPPRCASCETEVGGG